MGTDFDVDEIAQMFQDLDYLIVPDDGPPLPPLPVSWQSARAHMHVWLRCASGVGALVVLV